MLDPLAPKKPGAARKKLLTLEETLEMIRKYKAEGHPSVSAEEAVRRIRELRDEYFPAGVRIYLDTNIFIAAFERRDAVSDRLAGVFSTGLGRAERLFVTSELDYIRAFRVPLRDGNRALTSYYSDAVLSENEWLHVHPVAKPILAWAARLRADRKGLRLPDAIHLATALHQAAPTS